MRHLLTSCNQNIYPTWSFNTIVVVAAEILAGLPFSAGATEKLIYHLTRYIQWLERDRGVGQGSIYLSPNIFLPSTSRSHGIEPALRLYSVDIFPTCKILDQRHFDVTGHAD